MEYSGDAYLWIRAGHIISIIAWMAGLLYLPRLFVYHCQAEAGSHTSETFKVMERRLYKAIMNPAMMSSMFFGGLLLIDEATDWSAGWLHLKLLSAAGLLAIHLLMGGWMRAFAADANVRPENFFRYANEIPTILMIAIVLLAVLKPW